ncbi:MAG: HAD family phosphatase [Methylococcaceae bacterium]|nr:HAD family phosphatase [Methylococcaceae bacterium]
MKKLTKLQNISAVIFDMDGLVVDTESTYLIAWQQASLKMGYEFTHDFCISMSGLHYQDVENKLLDFCGRDFDLKLFNQLSGALWHEYVNQYGIAVKKGFFNFLEVIKTQNIPFGLATNSRKLNALECLQLANLGGVFSVIVTRDDVKHGKPAPDIFLAAAKALNRPISQCLVLEDSTAGIQAAVNSGACSIFIPSVHPFADTTATLADYLFDDLDQLAQIIKRA